MMPRDFSEAVSPFSHVNGCIVLRNDSAAVPPVFHCADKSGSCISRCRRVGIISEPVKCCRPSTAALCMCMSLRGKAHICLYIFMCVCVREAFISRAFDAHSLFLSFVKRGRARVGVGNVALLFYPKPLETTSS